MKSYSGAPDIKSFSLEDSWSILMQVESAERNAKRKEVSPEVAKELKCDARKYVSALAIANLAEPIPLPEYCDVEPE